MNSLLSVVIPTRNRQSYLLDVVQTVRKHVPDAEIVVADNSAEPTLERLIPNAIGSTGVNYAYSDETLSVTNNFERGLSLATGDYTLFLGDDDCIGPGLNEVASWAKRNRVDTVISYAESFVASYFWPGVRSKYYGNRYAAKVFVNKCSGTATSIDLRNAVAGAARNFGGGLGYMPRLYHGLVSRAVLERVKTRFGRVFGSVSPDIYSATLIAAEARNCYMVNYPFVIPGASPKSAAGAGAGRSDRGGLKTTEHTARFGDGLGWDQRIPEFYSPFNVWALSLLKAIELVPELAVEPYFPRLYAKCLLRTKGYSGAVKLAATHWTRTTGRGKLAAIAAMTTAIAAEGTEIALWLGRRLAAPRPGGKAESISELETISRAYDGLQDWLVSRGVALRLPELASAQDISLFAHA